MPAGVLVGIATKAKTRAPVIEHAALGVGPRGLAGERSHPAARAVTLVSREGWRDACRALGEALPWTLRRANLLIEGLALGDCVGRRLRVGSVLLEISEDNPPCRVMDLQHAGLRGALEPAGRAGVACRVLAPGELRVGDAVAFED